MAQSCLHSGWEAYGESKRSRNSMKNLASTPNIWSIGLKSWFVQCYPHKFVHFQHLRNVLPYPHDKITKSKTQGMQEKKNISHRPKDEGHIFFYTPINTLQLAVNRNIPSKRKKKDREKWLWRIVFKLAQCIALELVWYNVTNHFHL